MVDSVIESLAPPADAMRLQLTGGVNHRLAPGERRLLDGDEAGGVAGDCVQLVPGDGRGNGGRLATESVLDAARSSGGLRRRGDRSGTTNTVENWVAVR